jgi:hypothetical protein
MTTEHWAPPFHPTAVSPTPDGYVIVMDGEDYRAAREAAGDYNEAALNLAAAALPHIPRERLTVVAISSTHLTGRVRVTVAPEDTVVCGYAPVQDEDDDPFTVTIDPSESWDPTIAQPAQEWDGATVGQLEHLQRIAPFDLAFPISGDATTVEGAQA